jgi:hypothetical protein
MEINPVGRWLVSVGKLNRTHLSNENSTLVDESLNCTTSRVLCAVKRIVCSVSTAGSDTLDVVDIFDAETQLSPLVSICRDFLWLNNLRQLEAFLGLR